LLKIPSHRKRVVKYSKLQNTVLKVNLFKSWLHFTM